MSDEVPAQPGSGGLVPRAKAMLLKPREEWPRVAAETTEPVKLLTSYAIPLALIGPVAALIGMQIFGINVVFATVRPSLGFSITTAITTFVLSLVGLFVLAFIANILSPKFGGRDSFPAAFRWVTYAMTASWIGGIFGLIPALSIIGLLFSIYSLYVLYLGSGPVMGVPEGKTLTFTIVTIVAAIVLYLVAGVVTAAITGGAGLAGGGIAANDEVTTHVDLGDLGSVTVDGANQTVDLGELGRVEISGGTAKLTVDGQEIEVPIDEAALRAAAGE